MFLKTICFMVWLLKAEYKCIIHFNFLCDNEKFKNLFMTRKKNSISNSCFNYFLYFTNYKVISLENIKYGKQHIICHFSSSKFVIFPKKLICCSYYYKWLPVN